MAESTLVKKLLIKPGQKAAVSEAVPGQRPGALDFVQLFVKNKAELEAHLPAVLKALKNDGLLWVCYPKGGAKVTTDLNRDILWSAMGGHGMAGVAMVSVDAVWSAMRFRPTDKVGK